MVQISRNTQIGTSNCISNPLRSLISISSCEENARLDQSTLESFHLVTPVNYIPSSQPDPEAHEDQSHNLDCSIRGLIERCSCIARLRAMRHESRCNGHSGTDYKA